MKIAVISDTHKLVNKTLETLKNIENLDLIIHLGDYVKDAKEIEKAMNIETIYVRGNGDYLDTDVDLEKILEIHDKKIFLTHGHNYDVKNGISKIFYRAKEIECDIVLFGHTHMSTLLEYEGILILNPGSPEEPSSVSEGSIGLLEILKDNVKSEIIIL